MIGQTLGGYSIQKQAEESLWGTTYEADHPSFGLVSLEVLSRRHAKVAEDVSRFRSGGEALANLRHDGLRRVYEVGSEGKHHFIAREPLPGQSVAEILATRGPFDPLEAIRITWRIAGALQVAHRAGLRHQAIRPANIVFDDRTKRAILIGFPFEIPPMHPDSGLAMEAPWHFAPEQLRGAADDGRADVYALALVMFEMCTGENPFRVELGEMMRRKFEASPPSLCALRPEIPEAADQILQQAMAIDPRHRTKSAGELAVLLYQAFLAPSTHASSPSPASLVQPADAPPPPRPSTPGNVPPVPPPARPSFPGGPPPAKPSIPGSPAPARPSFPGSPPTLAMGSPVTGASPAPPAVKPTTSTSPPEVAAVRPATTGSSPAFPAVRPAMPGSSPAPASGSPSTELGFPVLLDDLAGSGDLARRVQLEWRDMLLASPARLEKVAPGTSIAIIGRWLESSEYFLRLARPESEGYVDVMVRNVVRASAAKVALVELAPGFPNPKDAAKKTVVLVLDQNTLRTISAREGRVALAAIEAAQQNQDTHAIESVFGHFPQDAIEQIEPGEPNETEVTMRQKYQTEATARRSLKTEVTVRQKFQTQATAYQKLQTLCMACEKPVGSMDRFCSHCGASREAPHCPHCGVPITSDKNRRMFYDHENGYYPWNAAWNGHCQNCGFEFAIKMSVPSGHANQKPSPGEIGSATDIEIRGMESVYTSHDHWDHQPTIEVRLRRTLPGNAGSERGRLVEEAVMTMTPQEWKAVMDQLQGMLRVLLMRLPWSRDIGRRDEG